MSVARPSSPRLTAALPGAILTGMDDEMRARAEARLERALATSPLQDPRDSYRDRLRMLKERDAAAFGRALRYFEDELVPRVAEDGSDPVAEWLEYGRLLAELAGTGRIVGIDASGRAKPAEPLAAGAALLLYLPDDARDRAFALALPREPSAPQQATHDLLVRRRTQV